MLLCMYAHTSVTQSQLAIGVSVSDMRHSGHVPPLSESGHGAPAALSHPCPK